MGVHQNIGFEKFPKQGEWLNKKVKVYFNYDTSKSITGIIVRFDREEPGVDIIKLDDGRYVLATECHYQLIRE